VGLGFPVGDKGPAAVGRHLHRHVAAEELDAPLLEDLGRLFAEMAADAAVRAAVIAGEGRAFSAGLDLKSAPTLDRAGQRRLVDALNGAFGTLYGWPKPLVAAIQGHAIAGGLILALCADWRVVADAPMQLSLAEVRVGVTYPVSPLEIARAELSPAVARRLVLLGDPGRNYFSAQGLEELGRYEIPTSLQLENRGMRETVVWRVLPVS